MQELTYGLRFLFREAVEDFDPTWGQKLNAKKRTLGIIVRESNPGADFLGVGHLALPNAKVGCDRFTGCLMVRNFQAELCVVHCATPHRIARYERSRNNGNHNDLRRIVLEHNIDGTAANVLAIPMAIGRVAKPVASGVRSTSITSVGNAALRHTSLRLFIKRRSICSREPLQ
jgi:hypothetical protein